MFNLFAGLIARLRFLFVLPVLALVLLSLASIAAGLQTALIPFLAEGSEFPGAVSPEGLSGIVPAFLRAAFLYFLAVALGSLFLGDMPVPQWMQVRNLFQFKNKVLTFLAVILPLFFLGFMVQEAEAWEILQAGMGIAFVLGGIFLMVRLGQPSGDEANSREGNRPPRDAETPRIPEKSGGKPAERPPEKGGERGGDRFRGDRDQAGKSGPRDDKGWLDRQMQELKFEKESLVRAAEEGSSVTVKPGPRKFGGRRRRRGGQGGGGQGGGGQAGQQGGQGGGGPEQGGPSGPSSDSFGGEGGAPV